MTRHGELSSLSSVILVGVKCDGFVRTADIQRRNTGSLVIQSVSAPHVFRSAGSMSSETGMVSMEVRL